MTNTFDRSLDNSVANSLNPALDKQEINVGEYTAAYTSIGEGEPIIFLHGFFGDGWTLKPIMENLKDDYCCIGLDLLGFGDSSKPKLRYVINHQVDFLHNFLTAKNIHNFYLFGYSYGAWVAAAYGIFLSQNNIHNHPLKGLALIAPTGIRDDSFVGRYDHLKPLLWETKLVDLGLNILTPVANLLGQKKYFQTIRQARNAIVSQPAAKSFLCDRLKPEDAIDTVENDIYKIQVPAVAIAGGNDQHIPLWHTQTYADRIPQGHLEIIPGADHDLVQTHSQEVSQVLRRYLLNRE